MYPKLSDLINDLLGTDINLPIQSYGFFVAMAFLVSGLLFYFELKRKEKEGLLVGRKKKIIKGKPASATELIISLITGFIIGFKLFGIFNDYTYFAENPQDYLFSTQGSWTGGIILGLASAAFTFWSKHRKKLDKPVEQEITVHPYQLTGSIILVAAISGIIGAKIFHQFEYWDDFIEDPVGSLFSFSGLTFYGGLIVATFVVVWYSRRNGINWKHLGDAIAPSLMIAYGLGRIGCQVSGDGDWGIVNTAAKPGWLNWIPDWLWAYDYPHNILKQGIPIEGCTGEYCYKLAETVYPTPVYETLMCLILFATLWFLRKRIHIPGLLFAIYLIFNGVERFLIEKIRVNSLYDIFGMRITQAEIISFIFVILGIIGILYFRNSYKRDKLKS